MLRRDKRVAIHRHTVDRQPRTTLRRDLCNEHKHRLRCYLSRSAPVPRLRRLAFPQRAAPPLLSSSPPPPDLLFFPPRLHRLPPLLYSGRCLLLRLLLPLFLCRPRLLIFTPSSPSGSGRATLRETNLLVEDLATAPEPVPAVASLSAVFVAAATSGVCVCACACVRACVRARPCWCQT